jgi:hypothetical protein
MEESNYYNKQALENFRLLSNNTENNNNSFPLQSFLTIDSDYVKSQNGKSFHHEVFLFFLQYLIAFPVFLLCWVVIVSYLKRRGHITQSDAESMIDELKDIRIASPNSLFKR